MLDTTNANERQLRSAIEKKLARDKPIIVVGLSYHTDRPECVPFIDSGEIEFCSKFSKRQCPNNALVIAFSRTDKILKSVNRSSKLVITRESNLMHVLRDLHAESTQKPVSPKVDPPREAGPESTWKPSDVVGDNNASEEVEFGVTPALEDAVELESGEDGVVVSEEPEEAADKADSLVSEESEAIVAEPEFEESVESEPETPTPDTTETSEPETVESETLLVEEPATVSEASEPEVATPQPEIAETVANESTSESEVSSDDALSKVRELAATKSVVEQDISDLRDQLAAAEAQLTRVNAAKDLVEKVEEMAKDLLS